MPTVPEIGSLTAKRKISALVFAALLIGSLWAYYEIQFYGHARLNAAIERAERGDVKAQMLVGSIYTICCDIYRMNSRMLAREQWSTFEILGYLIVCNPVEGGKWYRRAAESGDAEAEYRLGQLYRDAGNQSQMADADKWFRKAAQHGYPAARSSTGGATITLPRNTFTPFYVLAAVTMVTGALSVFLLFFAKRLPAKISAIASTIGFFGALLAVVPCLLVMVAIVAFGFLGAR